MAFYNGKRPPKLPRSSLKTGNIARHAKIVDCQATRIIDRFGGHKRLRDVLSWIDRPHDLSCIYRWTYSKASGGTGGVIPINALTDVLRAAKAEGLILSPEDLNPQPRIVQPKGWRIKDESQAETEDGDDHGNVH